MVDKKIAILGAGITGLTVAEKLSRKLGAQVIVLEKEATLGGLAATWVRNGLSFDLGSHRVHIKSLPRATRYMEEVLAGALLRRRRLGKLYFSGKFLQYPPNAVNLLKVFSTSDIFSSAVSYLKGYLSWPKGKQSNFEAEMIRVVGRDIYKKVYRGYARKLWGIDPRDMSVDAMHRRKTVLELKSLLTMFQERHYFLYPRLGIGSITQALEERFIQQGGKVIRNAQIKSAVRNGREITLSFQVGGERTETLIVSKLISTIPIDDLYGLLYPVANKQPALNWRGIRLVYILIDRELKDQAETYYFPSEDIILGRVSEVKKYSPYINTAISGTLLTIEIPVSRMDKIWEMDEKTLVDLCMQDLYKTGIIQEPAKVVDQFSLRFDKVYPRYQLGWREEFQAIYQRLQKEDNLFTLGRAGLFLHCNLDHCITQGLELADFILQDGPGNKEKWHSLVKMFLNYSARD